MVIYLTILIHTFKIKKYLFLWPYYGKIKAFSWGPIRFPSSKPGRQHRRVACTLRVYSPSIRRRVASTLQVYNPSWLTCRTGGRWLTWRARKIPWCDSEVSVSTRQCRALHVHMLVYVNRADGPVWTKKKETAHVQVTKYEGLVADLRDHGYMVKFCTIEVGTRGLISSSA